MLTALDPRPDLVVATGAFMMESPGYQLHLWRPETGVVTHTAVIGDFAGPYPFFEDGALIDGWRAFRFARAVGSAASGSSGQECLG